MIRATWNVSSFFVDKPITRTLDLEEDTKAMESPKGDVMSIGDLNNHLLEQYVYEKHINRSGDRGRAYNLTFEKIE